MQNAGSRFGGPTMVQNGCCVAASPQRAPKARYDNMILTTELLSEAGMVGLSFLILMLLMRPIRTSPLSKYFASGILAHLWFETVGLNSYYAKRRYSAKFGEALSECRSDRGQSLKNIAKLQEQL